MDFKKLLSEAIDSNTKVIITGRSGWGKSEMITQVAEEKGMELIDFRLSEVLPEDLVGIPKVKDDFYEYIPPRWLYEVVQHPEKKYLLFLDEITQGTPEVLNICYKIFDKITKVGNYTLNNVAVVGATNYQSESDYLSELPIPLKNRACMLELDHSPNNALVYLSDKYSIKDTDFKNSIKNAIREYNPRSVEKAINLIKSKVSKELVVPYIGLQYYVEFSGYLNLTEQAEGVTPLEKARVAVKQGFIPYGKLRYKIHSVDDLKYQFGLSDEEVSVISGELADMPTPNVKLTNGFLSVWAAKQKNLTNEDIFKLAGCPSFNPTKYLNAIPLRKPEQLALVQDAVCSLLNMNITQLLEFLCKERTLTLDVMKHYRKEMPWDLMKEHYKKGWLSEDKVAEFRRELFR